MEDSTGVGKRSRRLPARLASGQALTDSPELDSARPSESGARALSPAGSLEGSMGHQTPRPQMYRPEPQRVRHFAMRVQAVCASMYLLQLYACIAGSVFTFEMGFAVQALSPKLQPLKVNLLSAASHRLFLQRRGHCEQLNVEPSWFGLDTKRTTHGVVFIRTVFLRGSGTRWWRRFLRGTSGLDKETYSKKNLKPLQF